MSAIWQLTDDLGPSQVLHLHEPSVGLKAIVVVDNVACGPSIGGTRMAPDVSVEECARLARAMTLKNAAAGLPHGGGKSVIFAEAKMPSADKERLLRAFAHAIRRVEDYIPGPDMGTDETCMAWVHDEIGRSVGLPPELGGIPLDEVGATGFGLSVCADVAKEYCDVDLDRARVVVQGFGSVGVHAARFLERRGCALIAAADSRATVFDPLGLDLEELVAHKLRHGSVGGFAGAQSLERDAVLDIECDIWIPAARPDVVTAENVGRLRTRLVVEGANIPITHEAERILAERGVLVVPDFIANAGGVICAAVEYRGGTQGIAFATIEEKVRGNTETVLAEARSSRTTPRAAALAMAETRVRRAMALRRWH